MIYILSWTTKKRQTFQATTFKVKENARTFQGLAQKFKDFSRLSEPCYTMFVLFHFILFLSFVSNSYLLAM